MPTKSNPDDVQNMISLDTLVHLELGRCIELDEYLALHPRQLLLVETDPQLVGARQSRTESQKQEQVNCITLAGKQGRATFNGYDLLEVNSLHPASVLVRLLPGLKMGEQLQVPAVSSGTLLKPLKLQEQLENRLIFDLAGEKLPELHALQQEHLLHLFKQIRLQCGRDLQDEGILVQINRKTLQRHSDRAKLALLVDAGQLQTNTTTVARGFIRLTQDSGCSEKLVSQIIIAGVHNSLGRAFEVTDQQSPTFKNLESTTAVGAPGRDGQLFVQTQVNQQFAQIGRPALQVCMLSNAISQAATSSRKTSIESSNTKEEAPEKYIDFSSAAYWEDRYRTGGTSDFGSTGRLAEFKEKIVNKFIADKKIKHLIEFGSGDGNMVSKFSIAEYIGVDVSPFIVKRCRQSILNDTIKSFLTNEEFLSSPLKADLTQSLDVIFHLVEDQIFEQYMNMLIESSTKYCIIYACNEDRRETDAIHVRRRKFTDWISNVHPNWRLRQITYNKYPHDGSRNPKNTSFSNFYFYERII